ncbi:MAG: hypothetical protein BWY42_01589 [Candidatus Omnitrophica bacterium ADurb.Bin277]|nr:MAG: hypothetical protein BWY42_01589 [Candidatus Omnitrophica bacterium ADurb.Bin277]
MGEIDPIPAFQFVAVADSGMDDKGVPLSPFKDQHRTDVPVDHLHRPLQGHVKQILRFEGYMTKIGQLLQGGYLRHFLVEGDKLLVELRLQGLKGRDDALDFIGSTRRSGFAGLFPVVCRRHGAGDPFSQRGDIVEDIADDGEGEKGKDEDRHDEEGDIFVF